MPVGEGDYTVDTSTFTSSIFDPVISSCGQATHSATAWFVMRLEDAVQRPINVTVSTVGSNYDTVLAVWTGSCGSFTLLDCSDDHGQETTSQLTFTALPQTTYSIEVAAFGPSGNGGLLELSLIYHGLNCEDFRVIPDTPSDRGWSYTEWAGADWKQWYWTETCGDSGFGSVACSFHCLQSNETNSLISPAMDLTGFYQPELYFLYYSVLNLVSAVTHIDVTIDGDHWTEDVLVLAKTNYHWRKVIVDLTGFVSNHTQVRFRVTYPLEASICIIGVDSFCIQDGAASAPKCALQDPQLPSILQPLQKIAWYAPEEVTLYKIHLGTDGNGIQPPTNLENRTDIGVTTEYFPSTTWISGETYYWQVIPYNSFGDAEDCPIWEFKVVDAIPLPYCETFDSGAFPNGWQTTDNFWKLSNYANGGPATDHSGNGFFVYAQDSSIEDYADLYTPYFFGSEESEIIQVSFWYFSYNSVSWADAGSLMVDLFSGGELSMNLWQSNSSEVLWQYVTFTLSANSTFFLRFRFQVGDYSYHHDIAIDDFCITKISLVPPCPQNFEVSGAALKWPYLYPVNGFMVYLGYANNSNEIMNGTITVRNEISIAEVPISDRELFVKVNPYNNMWQVECLTWTFQFDKMCEPFGTDFTIGWNHTYEYWVRWQVVKAPQDHTTGAGNFLLFRSGFAEKPIYFSSPSLNVSQMFEPELIFYLWSSYPGTEISLKLITDNGTDISIPIQPEGFPGWNRFSFNWTEYETETMQILFDVNSQYSNDFSLDDICIQPAPQQPPQCLQLMYSNVTGPFLLVSWELEDNTVEGVRIYFGMDGGGVETPADIENGTWCEESIWTNTQSLEPNQIYYLQIIPENRAGRSQNCTIYKIYTMPAIDHNHCEDFDGEDVPPGWTIDSTPPDPYRWQIIPAAYFTFPNYDHTTRYGRILYFKDPDIDFTTEAATIYTPSFNLSSFTNPRLTFHYTNSAFFNWSGRVSITTLSYSVDGGPWHDIQQYGFNNRIPWEKMVVTNLPVIDPQSTISFKFQVRDGEFTFSSVVIDDFCIENTPTEAPPCAELVNPPASARTSLPPVTALQWNSSSVDGVRLYFGTDGSLSVKPTNILNNATWSGSSTYITNKLDLNKNHFLQIVPFNSVGDAVDCPIWNLRTDAIDTPFCESFSSSQFPDKWVTDSTDGDGEWFISATAPYGAPVSPSTDGYMVSFFIFTLPSLPASSHLLSPKVNLLHYNRATLRFWFWNYYQNNRCPSLYVDVWNGLDWHLGQFVNQGRNSSGWEEVVMDLESFIGDELQVRFRVEAKMGDECDVSLDNICLTAELQGTPNCPTILHPNSLQLISVTGTRLMWRNNGGNVTAFYVSLGTNTEANNILNNENIGMTSHYDLPTLQPGTVYYVQVKPQNALGINSGCPIYNFTTESSHEVPLIIIAFDDGTFGNWKNDQSDSGEDWILAVGATYGPLQDYPANRKRQSDGGLLAMVDDSAPHSSPTNLISPIYDTSGWERAVLLFDYFNYNQEAAHHSVLHVDLLIHNDNTWLLDIAPPLGSISDDWESISVNLTDYVGLRLAVRFRVVETLSFKSDLAIDNLRMEVEYSSVASNAETDGANSTSSSSEYSSSSDEINTGNSSSEEGLPVAILVAVIVVPLVILLGVAVIIVILIRRRQNQNEEDSGLELQPVSRNYTNISDTQSGSSLLPPSQPSQSVQHYAKPRIDKEFAAYEVDYYELEFEEKIGAGAFGDVTRGKWRGAQVAIKMLRKTDLSDQELDEFRTETKIMKNLRPHTNLIQLLGVCTQPDRPLCIITEYMPKGSLDKYLQNHDNIPPQQILKWCRGIAAGMMHLHLESIVHRDLAARNVLLTETLDVKISDFGLSRITEQQESVGKTKTEVGPLKWMAPESILEKIYSTKSDVWSYGVVIFEILTHEEPYKAYDPVQTASRVALGGLKLEIPREIVSQHPVYESLNNIMLHCLQYHAEPRPTMKQIETWLEQITV